MANPYFNAAYYLTNNPDLFAAGINTPEGAWNHYVTYGAAESLASGGRKPAPWFDAKYYLESNPDLSTAGLNPGDLFEHFTNYGINEGRAPAAGMGVTHDQLKAYAAANEDLREAFGIEDVEDISEEQYDQLAQQFYQYGYQEDRDGAPFDAGGVDPDAGETFTLTTGVDDWTGTAGNDVANAIVGTGATLNSFDSIDGAGGNNTLNIIASGAVVVPTGASVKNFQTVNVLQNGANAVNVAGFQGAQEIWQIGAAGAISGLTNGQTAGFRDVAANTGSSAYVVNAAAAATSVAVAVDGAGDEFAVSVTGTKVTTLSISGTLEDDAKLSLIALPEELETLNLALDSDTVVAAYTGTAPGAVAATTVLTTVTTFDASASTGDLSIGLATLSLDAETITLGSGNDGLSLAISNLDAEAVAVDLGAGNDTIEIALSEAVTAVAADATDVSLTLNGGLDTVAVTDGLSNVISVNAADEAFAVSLLTIEDFSAGDTLDVSATGVGITGFATQTAVDQAVDGAESLYEALVAVGNLSITTATVAAVFVFEGNTYLYADIGADGFNAGDGLIEFAGAINLDSSNVIFAA